MTLARNRHSLASCQINIIVVISIISALIVYSRLYAVDLESIDRAFSKGAAYLDSGKYEEAIKSFQKCIELLPQNDAHLDNVYDNIGLAYRGAGDIEKAVVYFNKSISINPDFSYPRLHLINAYRQKRDYPSAVISCFDVFKIKSDVIWPHDELWKTYAAIGRDYGYDKELILREVYHIEKTLENLARYKDKEFALQELQYLISIEKDIETMSTASNNQRIFPKGISEMSKKEMEGFVANIGQELKLPEDNISQEEKLKYFEKAKRRE